MESHQGLWGPYTLFPCWVFQWSQAFLCLRRTPPPSPLKVSGGIVKCEVFAHSMLPTGRVCVTHSAPDNRATSLAYTGTPGAFSVCPDGGMTTHRPGSLTGTVPHTAHSWVGLGLLLQNQASASGKSFLAGNLHSLKMVVIVGRSGPDQVGQVGQVGHPAGKETCCTVKTCSFRMKAE